MSSSMEPTIKSGEVVRADLNAFSKSVPKRWDVIVFEPPSDPSSRWVSRIVGLPGEAIEIRFDGLYIDGKKESPPPNLAISIYKPLKDGITAPGLSPVSFPYKLPAGKYFVLGDNTQNSLDSRYWGGLEASKILGRIPGK